MPARPASEDERAPGRGAWNCLLVGTGTMLRECASLLTERGHRVVGVASDDADVRAWAESEALPLATVGDGSGVGWDFGPVDYLFSIVNLVVLGERALDLPRHAAINFHDGPLPEYAGVNTTSWALLNREDAHAVTWHVMHREVDRGAVLARRSIPIDPHDTALSLNAKCFEAGLESFRLLVERLSEGVPLARDGGTRPHRSYGRSDRPAAGGLLDFSRSADDLALLARALEHGTYANRLALPAVRSEGRTILVRSIGTAPSRGSAPPGTVLDVGDAIRVRASDGDVLLGKLERHDGTALTGDEATRELGIGIGGVLPAITPEEERHFARAAKRWLRYEDAWVGRLEDLRSVQATHLFAGRRGDEGTTVEAGHRTVALDLGSVADRLGSDERRGDAALAVVLLLVARLEGGDDVDVPFRHPGLPSVARSAMSRFASHVPLRVPARDGRSFEAFRDEVLSELAATAARGSYPRDVFRRFPTLRRVDPNWPRQTWPIAVERVANVAEDVPAGDAALSVQVPDDGRTCVFRFDPARVAESTVRRLQQRLLVLCEDLVAGRTVDEARVVAAADVAELAPPNRTHADPPRESAVHRAIEAQVMRTPERTALVAGRARLSYRDLNARANRLARRLQREGVGRGSRVGIMMRRNHAMVVALLATWKAGAAYVPLDPEFPASRIAFMIQDADLALLLTDRESAPALTSRPEPVVIVDERTMSVGEDADLDVHVDRDDLAYTIYTSGSTGRPKGVMVEHGNVLNFLLGMDARLSPSEAPGTWLAVTSISFDISVLELAWTLARGFEVVLYSGDDRRVGIVPAAPTPGQDLADPVQMSLFYFANDAGRDEGRRYRLLLEGARFADRHGFAAVWTPERHFHAFGGLYPNPAVTGSAIAAVTENVRIRAGSCVLPLHHPVRIAEEWAVVDNISGGRVDVSFASGWQPNDFVFAPEAYETRNESMYRGIETVRALWRGESVSFEGPSGTVEVKTLPRPLQPELPVWVTAAGNPATFRKAGEIGANLLTHMLGQDRSELAEKIRMYREGWAASGRPGHGHVTVMMHTFVGPEPERVREPLRSYLRSSAQLMKQFASSFPAFRGTDTTDREAMDARFRALDDEDLDALLDHAFERYYATRGLFGSIEDCRDRIHDLQAVGVNEIACLIDFGLPTDVVLEGLPHLARLREALQVAPEPRPRSIPELIGEHGITHLQCTPSMAQMLVAEPQGRAALASLRCLLVGGEALPKGLARTLSALVDGPVVNMYGPTETTIWSSTHDVSSDPMTGHESAVAIGDPIANTCIYVCDPRGRPLPPNVEGEIVIGGAGVARGYWRRPEITRERFVEDQASEDLGLPRLDRLYRTGDLGRWRSDGTLEYLGRLDFQVKVRGHRIELGEIESVLEEHPDVRQAVVTTRPGAGGDVRIVAYVTTAHRAPNLPRQVRQHAVERLPAVMVPDAIVELEAFPLTPNKKIDRRALPEPTTVTAPRDDHDSSPPNGALEALVADVWRRVLNVETIGAHDDFFASGGNSLLAVFTTSELRKHGHEVSLAQLLRHPTVASLARSMAEAPPRPTESPAAAADSGRAGSA